MVMATFSAVLPMALSTTTTTTTLGSQHGVQDTSGPPTAASSIVTTPTDRYHDGQQPLPPPQMPPAQQIQQQQYPPGSVDAYERIKQVGEGTYGKVYKAMHNVTKQVVALKRIRMEQEKEGFPVTAMREIKLLQHLNHPYVVRLHEIISSKGTIYMVFEYLQHDLTGVLAHPMLQFSPANIKCLMQQLLEGCAYLHSKGILHRDIKGSNLLLNTEGQLKLADFGLARINTRSGHGDLTNRVITLWYRPPELLLGSASYAGEVDIWGIGCIMMELIFRRQPFQGQDEPSQLDAIFQICGSPDLVVGDHAAGVPQWAGASSLPWWQLMRPKDPIPRKMEAEWGPYLSPKGLHLLDTLLCLDPTKRVTAKNALSAAYFTSEAPAPEQITALTMIDDDWHEFDAKARRRRGEIPAHDRTSRPPTASSTAGKPRSTGATNSPTMPQSTTMTTGSMPLDDTIVENDESDASQRPTPTTRVASAMEDAHMQHHEDVKLDNREEPEEEMRRVPDGSSSDTLSSSKAPERKKPRTE